MKRLLSLLGVFIALIGVGAVSASSPSGIPPGFAMPGIRVVHLDSTTVKLPLVASEHAVDAARTHWQWPSDAQVATRLVVFSDDDYADAAGRSIIQDRPVWLVTVTGIDYYGRGPTDDVNHEVHLAVDAVTGQVLEQFSFR